MIATINTYNKTLIITSSFTLSELGKFMEEHNILDYTVTVNSNAYGYYPIVGSTLGSFTYSDNACASK